MVLGDMETLKQQLAEHESTLASCDIMTSNVDALRTMQYQLRVRDQWLLKQSVANLTSYPLWKQNTVYH